MKAESYDVAIIGGALSGAATALLLLRDQPDLKVLVLEKSTAFGRRVGEATVEVSGYFLGRVLGLTQHLNEAHLVKQGDRKSTRLNSSHGYISYAVFCLKKKKKGI